MLAWLQRGLVLGLTVLAAVVGMLVLRAGAPPWAAALAAIAAFNVHALFLAVEFVLLSRVEPGAGLPRPRLSALLGAWWGEIWVGLQIFCWRQPFRSRAWPDGVAPLQDGPHAVLLVHGFVCNRGLWNPWMRRLAAADIAYTAVNLEPVFGSIDRYVPIIEEGVRRLEALGCAKPIIVAHSMGGLAVRAWLREYRSEHRVHRIVTIATPHRGTRLARFALTPNARQMRPDSRWLLALAADETAQRRALFTCFFGHCDNIVFPASMATLAGADNRHVPGIAHVHLAFHASVIDEVLALSTAGAATPGSGPVGR
jgi:triacylglycerol lipase